MSLEKRCDVDVLNDPKGIDILQHFLKARYKVNSRIGAAAYINNCQYESCPRLYEMGGNDYCVRFEKEVTQ